MLKSDVYFVYKQDLKSTFMNIRFKFFSLFHIISVIALLTGLFASPTLPARAAEQNANYLNEPNCQTATSTAAWNPYPVTTVLDSPDVTAGNCKDMPLISFKPIDTNAGNPRTKTIIDGESVSLQFYYNNGAKPNSLGDPKIVNPVIKAQLVKVSSTQFKIQAQLSGDNVPTVTSAQKGGDLIINTPANTSFKIVRGNTRHFIDANERFYVASNNPSDRRAPYNAPPWSNFVSQSDIIPDASLINSNPIWSAFDGTNLESTSGFQIKPQLEAGFLGFGYILTDILATTADANDPPVLPGETITVVRGSTGVFQKLNGTDPNNDYPLTYDLSNLPSYCTVTEGGSGQNGPSNTGPQISCTTNNTTPTPTTFTISPIDSKGLKGTSGTFIMNIIDPVVVATKECFVKDTQTACSASALKPGDKVTYKVNVESKGTSTAKNVKIIDDYDETRLLGINNISDNGNLDTNTNLITWSIGDLNIGAKKSVTFDATVSDNANSGDIIINTATIKSDGIPDIIVKVNFTVGGSALLVTSDKTCVKTGTTVSCANANLKPGDSVTYQINARNTGVNTAKNLTIVDTYDNVRLTGVKNINPQGTVGSSVITWNLGDLAVGGTKSVNFDAVVSTNVANGDIVINLAVIKADGVPDQNVQVDFPIVIVPGVITPRTGGFTLFSVILGLSVVGFGFYYTKKHPKWAAGFIPKRSGEAGKK